MDTASLGAALPIIDLTTEAGTAIGELSGDKKNQQQFSFDALEKC
jgi:hypothetical protein